LSRHPPPFLFAVTVEDSRLLGFVGAMSPTAATQLGVGSDFYLSPSFNHYRSAHKIRWQAQNAILPWLDLLAVDPRELQWATPADFQPEASLAKAQVRLNRRAARIKRRPDGEGAILEVHPQVMPYHE
jgi:hypothetical protein